MRAVEGVIGPPVAAEDVAVDLLVAGVDPALDGAGIHVRREAEGGVAGLAAAQEVLDAAPGSAWLLLRAYWIFDPDALLRPYFDARYCYETLFLPDNPYLFALKLVPRDTPASATCVEFDPDPYYPYTKTGPGTLRLTGPD